MARLFLPAFLLLLCWGCVSGCQERASASATPGRGPGVNVPTTVTIRLANGERSQDGLVRAALAAFSAGDTATLERLLISRDEFERHIYPELGMRYVAARDMRPEARSFIWENQVMNSTKGLERGLRDLSGHHMELERVEHAEGGARYASYTIYEGTVARVRMEDGREADIHALGSVVEMDGVYKLLTYRERN
ncbi:MAG: hypothetical protein ABIR47_01385 [Candidatus Kapaibacterium sp.]